MQLSANGQLLIIKKFRIILNAYLSCNQQLIVFNIWISRLRVTIKYQHHAARAMIVQLLYEVQQTVYIRTYLLHLNYKIVRYY